MEKTALYRTLWRWHFYAGLFVMPFILILSLSGAVYLFKPQIERWEERAYQNLPTSNAVSADVQRKAALAAFPAAQFDSYRLPERDGDAALIHLGLSDGSMRDVFVSPQGKVLGSLNPTSRIIAIDHDIHGELLLGKRGSWLVELAASWALVMILTGLYLWWPRGRALAGVVWPRLRFGKRVFWRDLHAVTGFWVAGLALILLVSGLPWAGVWGSVFKMVRAETGLLKGKQDWTIGGVHAEHDHMAMIKMGAMKMPSVRLDAIVQKLQAEHLAFPVLIKPPAENMEWTVKSDAQNRPQRVTITYDMMSGQQRTREGFADKHAIDRVVGYGIAWHEGQLFGWINQLIGLLTATALITLMVSGFVMWRRRKPEDTLGAPPLPAVPLRMHGVVAIILILAILLPMLAGSLILLWVFERLVLPYFPRLSHWLGYS